jgi:heme/copper-type cytochrome/quinol oxidase subunit 2
VNHAFWVPEARMKIDAVSGLRTYVQWTPDKLTGPEDHFEVVCAELCGAGHNGMRTEMCVVTKGVYDWWTGLDVDKRADATCVNLRLFNCFTGDQDNDELLDAMVKLTKDDPEANCEKAEEAAA